MTFYRPVYVPKSKYGFPRRPFISLSKRTAAADPRMPHNRLLVISVGIFRMAVGW